MPFAAEGLISTDPMDGGLEITEQQYQDALAGMMAGKLVSIDGGFAVVDPPEPEAEPEPEPGPPTADDVWTEKDRRWALGFDYDFEDSRGVHHIATTPKDLDDWDKVSAAASAFIALGQPAATITIYTETGPATVTALEWQSVLVAAATHFQAAIDAAAALVAMDPIPADYADDSWWT